MTQLERVIKLATVRGDDGITQVDFLSPTADGGPTITRLAARILDAKAQGYRFDKVGERASCHVYRLAGGPEQTVSGGARDLHSLAATDASAGQCQPYTVAAVADAEPASLFDATPSMYDRFGDAA